MNTVSPGNIELSIVMPCLNEAETLKACIGKALKYLEVNNILGEVVIGDNGSTDSSPEIARNCNVKLVIIPTKGYGNAVKGAIEAACGKYVIMGDSDDSYDFGNLNPILEKLRAGYDIVIGNRFKGGIQPDAMPFLHRYVGNPVLSFIGRLFTTSNIGDFHCGLRGFRRDAISQLNLQTSGMEMATEMIVKATIKKLSVTEVPVMLYRDGRSRAPHLNTWRDGWRHLRFLLVYTPRWLFPVRDIVLMLEGFVIKVTKK